VVCSSSSSSPGFYLDLWIAVVTTALFLVPIKYVRYLARCVPDVEGKVVFPNGTLPEDKYVLRDKTFYLFERNTSRGLHIVAKDLFGWQTTDIEAVKELSGQNQPPKAMTSIAFTQ